MNVTRRGFFAATGVSAAGAAAFSTLRKPAKAADLSDWDAVRAEFDLDPSLVHLGMFFLASHPRPVREAVARFRRELDANPVLTVEHAMFGADAGEGPRKVKGAIGSYIGGRGEDIALVGSTTEGLALVYQGLRLRAGDEILTTDHDHFVHHESIRHATERAGATWRKVPLFDSIVDMSAGQMAERIARAIRPATRAVGITWVHSSTGLRTPLKEIAAAVAAANREREADERILLIVDGVHGIGAVDSAVASSGIDFFCAGTHKWILAPRGTGFVWGKTEAWARLRQTIPGFESMEVIGAWMEGRTPRGPARADWFSPGGFHAFEHFWAIPAAIDFHRAIGPERVAARIRELNGAVKEGLATMPHVRLHTPRAPEFSAGINCFEVEGLRPGAVVDRLLEKRIIATTSPYRVSYARLSCGIMNSLEDVEKALAAVRGLRAV